MFENIMKFFKKFNKKQDKAANNSKEAAKERLHLVLMQDRANVSADFLELMKQEIIEVIKKYIDVDEKEIDVRLTNKENADGTNGAPALYANIPILNIKNEARKVEVKEKTNIEKQEAKSDMPKVEDEKEQQSDSNEEKKNIKKEKNENTENKQDRKEQAGKTEEKKQEKVNNKKDNKEKIHAKEKAKSEN